MKKVLIVNDEEFLRNVLSTLLTELGFACFTASSSEDGEKLFFENPDLEAVLMDALGPEGVLYTLPLLKKIVDSGFKGVLVTMSSNPDYRKEMVNAGCTDEWDSVTGIPVLVRILNRESVMVLVVDDDEPFQFLVKRWLEEIPQVHVHQAFTTDEALALFETSLSESEKPYNIIMMDADLPGSIPVHELVRQMRAKGFKGDLVASSTSERAIGLLCSAGCNVVLDTDETRGFLERLVRKIQQS